MEPVRAARLSALLALLPVAASAAPAVSGDDSRRQLAEIQKELDATRRDIEQFKALEDSLGQELSKLASKNAEARHRMSSLQRNLRLAEERKTQLKTRLNAIGQASGFWRSSLEDDLRAYVADQASREDVYGTSDLWADDLRRRAVIEKSRLMASLQGVSATTAQAAARTAQQAVSLRQSSLKAQQEEQTEQQKYEQQKAAVADAQQKTLAAVARAKELEDSERALTRLVRRLGRGAQPYHKTGAVATLDLPRNSLDWPSEGTIIRPFGRQRNAELDTWVVNQGILLSTPANAPVTPVEDGKVIFAGLFRSYGEVLIVDHGSNFFSIYGNLGQLLTAKGAEVKAGDTIARAGGGAGGGSVYLELRRGTEALDPLLWLRKR